MDEEIANLKQRVAILENVSNDEPDIRDAWLRDSSLEKATKGREGWAAEHVLAVAQTYYNWIKTGRTDIVHQA